MTAFLALLLVQCSWSYEGGQGLGFMAAMLALVRTPEMRQRVWQKYRGQFNTNPFLAGTLAGIAGHYERRGSSEVDRFLGALQSGFGSSGDNFFWRLLRPGLSVLAVTLALFRPALGPFVFLLPFAALTQLVRVSGLNRGLEVGKQAAVEMSARLTAYSARMDVLMAFLVGVLGVRAMFTAGPAYLVIPAATVGWFGLRRPRFGSYLLLLSLLILLLVKIVL